MQPADLAAEPTLDEPSDDVVVVSTARSDAPRRRFLPGVWFPVAVFALWRVVHVVIAYLTIAHDNPRESFTEILARVADAPLAYDGERYVTVMHDGYVGWRAQMPNTAFFPLHSWLARPVSWVTGSDTATVNIMMVVLGLAAFVAVWGVSREWKDEVVARRAVVLLALFPSSLFLWAFYSEALFIALGAGAVWADRRGRHGITAALFVALAATRSIGILIPAVVVLVRIVRLRRIDRWALAYTAAGVVGMGVVLWAMHAQTGDALAWTKVQGAWGRELAPPWAAVLQGIDNLTPADDPDTIMIPALVARNWDLWCVGIVLAALAYAGFSRRDRWPAETWALGLAMIAVPLCSAVLPSFNRFVLATWVIYPVYASWWGRWPRWFQVILLVAVVAAAGYTTVALVERFTESPYPRFIG